MYFLSQTDRGRKSGGGGLFYAPQMKGISECMAERDTEGGGGEGGEEREGRRGREGASKPFPLFLRHQRFFANLQLVLRASVN